MAHRVCPVWIGYLLLNPFRKIFQQPENILSPYVKEGMTVLEIGPGMGYFSIPLARMVGPAGKVVAVDMQEGMLKVLRKRAWKAGIGSRIEPRLCKQNTLDLQDLSGRIDFALIFAVVHEVPDQANLFRETAAALKPGHRLLVAEPRGHVKEKDFAATVSLAEHSGFRLVDRPGIHRSHTLLLEKS